MLEVIFIVKHWGINLGFHIQVQYYISCATLVNVKLYLMQRLEQSILAPCCYKNTTIIKYLEIFYNSEADFIFSLGLFVKLVCLRNMHLGAWIPETDRKTVAIIQD